jgi:ubiquinone biosynthesis protein UbiJ
MKKKIAVAALELLLSKLQAGDPSKNSKMKRFGGHALELALRVLKGSK